METQPITTDTYVEIDKHFVVLDENFSVLLKGQICKQRNVMLSYRHDAPNKGHVSESYSSFDAILQIIPPGTLPTIQFCDEDKIKEFL